MAGKTSREILQAAGVRAEDTAYENNPAPQPQRTSAASSILRAAGVSSQQEENDYAKYQEYYNRTFGIPSAANVSHAMNMATLPGTLADGKTTNKLGAARLLNDTLSSGGSYEDWYKKLQEQSDSAEAARAEAKIAYEQAMSYQGGNWDMEGNYLGDSPLVSAEEKARLKAAWQEAETAAAWAAELAQMGKNSRYSDYSQREDFTQGAAAGRQAFERRVRPAEDTAGDISNRAIIAGMGGYTQESAIIDAYRDDTSYREPGEDWTQEERDIFHYLYNRDKEEAYAYAENLNNNKAAEKAYEKQQKAEEWATRNFGTGALATGASVIGQAFAGADYANKALEYIARGTTTQNDFLTPADYGSIMTGAIAESLNGKDSGLNRMLAKLEPVFGEIGAGDLYSVGYSVLQNMAYTYSTAGVGSLPIYFGIGAKSGYEDALLRGATPAKALTAGFASGLIETATEALSVEGLLRLKSTAGLKGFFKNVAKQAFTEASEETMNQLITPLAEALILGDKSALRTATQEYMLQGMSQEEAQRAAFRDWAKETAWSAMSGALSGGISGGITTGAQNLRRYKGDSGALIAEGLASPEGSKARELAQRFAGYAQNGRSDLLAKAGQAARNAPAAIGKAAQRVGDAMSFAPSAAFEREQKVSRQSRGGNGQSLSQPAADSSLYTREPKAREYRLRGGEAARLTEALNEQNRPQIEAQVKAQLEGAEVTGDIEALSRSMTKALLGEELGVIEEAQLKRNRPALAVLQEMAQARNQEGFKGSAGGAVRTAFGDEELIQAMREVEKGLPEYMRVFSRGETNYPSVSAADSSPDKGSQGGQNATAPAENGNEIAAQSLSQPVADSSLYTREPEEVTETELDKAMIEDTVRTLGVSRKVARTLILSRKDVDPDVYALGIQEAFEEGAQGLPRSQVGKDPESYAAKLNETQKRLAHRAGQLFGGKGTARAQAEVRKAVKQSKGRKGPGKVHYNTDKKSLNERQQKSIKVLERVAAALGVDFYIEPKGLSSNGWYNPSDGSIHIAADAGSSFEGSILFTAAHELSHFIQDWSPAKYRVLANFLFEQYAISGADVAERMTEQIAKARADGRKLTPGEAYDEVVADSMEKMLLDGRVLTQLEAIRQQDASLFSKMLEYFKKLFKRIQSLYSGLETNSEEARMVERMGADTVRKIQDYFTEGLADAGESYQAAGGTKNTTDNGGVRYSFNNTKSGMVNDGITPYTEELQSLIIKGGNVVVNSYAKLVEVVNTAIKEPQNKAAAYFGNISAEHLAAIESKIANLPQHLKGKLFKAEKSYSIAITFDTIRHIAEERKIGASELVDYLDRLADTILDADSINFDYYTDSRSNKLNGLLFKKRFPDGILATFEIVSNKKKSLNTQTMYIQAATQNRRKPATPPLMNKSSAHTPEARGGQTSSDKISQSNPDVKHQSRNPSAAELEEENAALRADVEKWKNLAKLADRVTNGKILDPTSVRPAAKWVMEQTGAKGNSLSLAEELKLFYNKVLKMKKPTWEAIETQAGGPVAWLMQNIKDTPKNAEERSLLEQNLAITIYDSLWKVSTITTTADRYKAEADQLRAEHDERMKKAKQTIKELREKVITEREAHKAEKEKIRREAEQKYMQKRLELLRQVEESRQRNAANREISNLRRLISREAGMIDRILNGATKERNVKEGMQGFVATALQYHGAIFADSYTPEEMIKAGFTVPVQKKEEGLISSAREIMRELEGATPGSDRERKLRGRLDYRIRKLNELIARQREAMYKANVDTVLNELLESYKKLQNSEYNYIKDSYDPELAAFLEGMAQEMSGQKAVDMSVQELRNVYDAFKAVHKAILNTNKAFETGADVRAEGAETVQEIKAAGGSKKQRTSLQTAARRFGFNNMKPVYFFKLMGSKTLSKYFRNVLRAEGVWAKDVEEAKAHARKLMAKYKYDSWDMNKPFKFKSTNGDEFELTVPQMLTLYALTQRGGSVFDHLRTGGFVFDPNSTRTVEGRLGIKKELNLDDATAYQLGVDELGLIARALSEEQKAFVKEMQDYLSTVMGGKGNEVSMKMYGIKLFKEERYFPLRVASQYMERIREAGSNERKIKNSGFTKPLKPNANNPVVLGDFTDIWSQHVNDMSMYHAFVLPLEDFYRVYNYKTRAEDSAAMESVNAAIQNAYGKPAAEYVDQLLKDINSGAIRDPRANLTTALVGKFKKASTFASASVIIQQPSSVGRAFALIDPKYFVGRRMDNLAHYSRWAEIKKYAPIAIIKEMGHFDTNMGRSTSDYIQQKEYKSLKEKIKGVVTDEQYRDDILSRMPALADEVTWCCIWEAVKRETAAKKPELKSGSEEFMQAVGERFTEVIQETQVYDSVLSRSAYMRSKDSGMTMLTAFMAEPTTTMNMVLNAIVQGRRGDKAAARRAIGAALTSVVMNAALVSIVYAMRDDDEYESFLEKYLASFAVEIADGVNPFTYFPVIRDIWSAAQGYDIERADMSLITDLMDSINNTTKLLYQDTEDMSEKEREAWLKKLKDALWKDADYITALVNLPVKNIRRDIMAVGNTIGTLAADYKTSPEGLKNVVGESLISAVPFLGQRPKDSKGDKIYAAIMAGDTEYADRLFSSYATESAAASALRKAMRDNEPRIVLAAAARLDGDTDEYMRIYNELLTEGNFERDDIIKAIESEMNAMSNSESYSTPASPDLIKPKDYYRAILAGDSAAVEAARQAYIQQELEKGKLEEDAAGSLESSVTASVRADYMEDAFTREDAMALLMGYGGKAEEDADAYLRRLDFEKQYGFSWDEREEAFRRGEISEQELAQGYMDMKGMNQEEAELEAEYIAVTAENPELRVLSVGQYKDYYTPPDGWSVSPADIGIDRSLYARYRLDTKGMTGEDLDGDGKNDPNSKKNKILAYIDSLPLTAEQKDLLYYQQGYKASTLDDAPWHK